MNTAIITGSDTLYVDVRTEEEFSSGHIAGAINIPLSAITSRKKEIERLGERPVVFYCRSGNRSAQAVADLHKLGYNNIFNGGSLDALQKLLKQKI